MSSEIMKKILVKKAGYEGGKGKKKENRKT